MDVNRYKEIEGTVDSSMMMKLEQVRKFLRRGKASVMVGAGFSKNAVMDEGVRMLDWGELCSGINGWFFRPQIGWKCSGASSICHFAANSKKLQKNSS